MTNAKRPNDSSGGSKTQKAIWKKWWFWAVIVVILGAVGSSSEDTAQPETETVVENEQETEQTQVTESEQETEPTQATESEQEQIEEPQKHIYDDAIIKDVMNGFRSEKIGEYSIIQIGSDQITEEVLADWYFNYVIKNDFNCCMILYTDKENEGVYAITGLISKNVSFSVDEYGDYSLKDSSKCVIYIPSEGETLKELQTTESEQEVLSEDKFVETVKAEIKDAVGEGEVITDVILENKDLCVYVDLSSTDNQFPIPLEDLAMSRTSSITDEILEFVQYEDLWETITVDFGELGYIRNGKDNIKDDGYGKYFSSENFKLETGTENEPETEQTSEYNGKKY